MKKLLLTAAAILATLNMYAQGTGSGVVNYNTTGAADANRVWVNSTGAAGEGTRAAGPSYVTALWWGPAGTLDDGNMVQVGGQTAFLTGAAAGTFFGSGRTITGLPVNGSVVSLQSRSWLVTGATGYADARENGKGPIFDLKLKDPSNALEVTPSVGGAVGWRGYAVTPVPEPSVIGLGLLGAGALLMLRRRK
jgi:hypothetical protein